MNKAIAKAMSERIERLEAELTATRKALEEYGTHINCGTDSGQQCSCGWAKTAKELNLNPRWP